MEKLNLDSEQLRSFRDLFDISLRHMLENMEQKSLQSGTITGKIKVSMERIVDRETGEMMTMLSLKPDVSVKLGFNGKAECETIYGLHMVFDRNGDPIVSENQITMDELLKGA